MATERERQLELQLAEVREELQAERDGKAVRDAAKKVRELHESYVDVGFTDEQAYELTVIAMKGSMRF